ncbi:HAD family hydrolase [Tranquillimonas alkanivorans]|uniref:Haloacid dehalogenase superfamily, subfamily IA, variant 3 with third motif having DD or ED n=1 Tax=Tranquillimonas alkanivorans TaxID=441119 RepID=A0A1I5NG84_9RHOB|nr:HAD family phosphatase [Tranquillimonas alkanivorans]SFP20737.1 haloacid dehalogenase superfamily, subfamily IA, variant 3 with third motif having DD or ED [Tranquillimonas alkanivorans]
MPALLFDLDGTLLHSDPLHAKIFQEIFAARGQEIDEAFYTANIHGRENADIFGEFFPDEDAARLSDEKEATFRDRLGRREPTPGTTALLDRAHRAGWGIALVTNAPRLNAHAMLDAIGLVERFGTIVVGEECERGKPHPAPYRAAMEALGVASRDSVAFEDSRSGVASARAAGVFTVGLRSSLTHDQLCAAGADTTIADFTDTALDRILGRLEGATA